MLVMTSLSKPAYKKYILSIAHTDYTMSVGGVEKLIGEHEIMFREKQISYVFLCPMKPDLDIYKFIIDGNYYGDFSITSILQMLSVWDRELVGVHIHHVWLWKTDDVIRLISSVDGSYYVFLHDYYLICHHYNLVNSSGSFCGGGPVSLDKCYECSFYEEERLRFIERMPIMDQLRHRKTVFVAPSDYVQKLWIDTFPEYRDNTVVIEHLVFSDFLRKKKELFAPYRVAYVGSQIKEKGWLVFKSLTSALEKDPRYQFYHFGLEKDHVDGIINIPVSYQSDGNEAMPRLINEYGIDFVIFYSMWPETYNFTCYEAYLGGAFLITNEISGNIQNVVKKYKCGTIVKDTEALMNLFSTGKATQLLERYVYSESYRLPLKCMTNDRIVEYTEHTPAAVIYVRGSNLIVEAPKAIRIKAIRILKKIYR